VIGYCSERYGGCGILWASAPTVRKGVPERQAHALCPDCTRPS
jgi:hypothetical protein